MSKRWVNESQRVDGAGPQVRDEGKKKNMEKPINAESKKQRNQPSRTYLNL
jgi:hypothetical protein